MLAMHVRMRENSMYRDTMYFYDCYERVFSINFYEWNFSFLPLIVMPYPFIFLTWNFQEAHSSTGDKVLTQALNLIRNINKKEEVFEFTAV
jgi:hypothetical protein